VNAVAPGYIDTDLLRRSLSEANPGREATELLAEAVAQHPLRRIGRPKDIAEAVLFLASARSAFITGQTLIVDGGLTSQVRTSGLAEQPQRANVVLPVAHAAVDPAPNRHRVVG
jgi:NAD(P)-dependent dehydrogenase (short-subunit alcohol dehydrogenase family)